MPPEDHGMSKDTLSGQYPGGEGMPGDAQHRADDNRDRQPTPRSQLGDLTDRVPLDFQRPVLPTVGAFPGSAVRVFPVPAGTRSGGRRKDAAVGPRRDADPWDGRVDVPGVSDHAKNRGRVPGCG